MIASGDSNPASGFESRRRGPERFANYNPSLARRSIVDRVELEEKILARHVHVKPSKDLSPKTHCS
jgi:hypothetical protein